MRIIRGEREAYIPFEGRISLASLLESAGFPLDKPCGGRGVCGKCRVRAEGAIGPPSADGFCLACKTFAVGNDVTVTLDDSPAVEGLTEGTETDFVLSPLTGESDCFGAAVDIGTTTVAGYLWKLPDGRLVKSLCLPNTQAEFGADVVSRLEYAGKGGLDTLRSRIRGQINALYESFGVTPELTVIVGNTAMLHLCAGLDPSGMAQAPFVPASLFGERVGRDHYVRCISAYLGADTVAAVLASGMTARPETSLLIDIGTNGELALFDGGRLLCCSTAAGPAFEGAEISQGMRSVPGAIDHVRIDDGRLVYTTVGGEKARGICGSGLIDAAACMLSLGALDETGFLAEPFEVGDSGVFVTAADVRKLQLAKAAIRAGIETLLGERGLTYGEIGTLYLAGGFGSFADRHSCAAIGLLPPEFADKIVVLGNAAGVGASMILRSGDCLARSEELARSAEVLELSGSARFADEFIERIMF